MASTIRGMEEYVDGKGGMRLRLKRRGNRGEYELLMDGMNIKLRAISETELVMSGCGRDASSSGMCSRVVLSSNGNKITVPGLGEFVSLTPNRPLAQAQQPPLKPSNNIQFPIATISGATNQKPSVPSGSSTITLRKSTLTGAMIQ